ncbi:MAG: hypothetical protein WC868_10460 [Bacteroidales bacterium]
MTNKEKIQRDIELTFDFIRQIIDNPRLAEQLPDKCEIDFIEKDFTSLTEKDLTKKQLIKVNHTFDIVKNKKSHAIAD